MKLTCRAAAAGSTAMSRQVQSAPDSTDSAFLARARDSPPPRLVTRAKSSRAEEPLCEGSLQPAPAGAPSSSSRMSGLARGMVAPARAPPSWCRRGSTWYRCGSSWSGRK